MIITMSGPTLEIGSVEVLEPVRSAAMKKYPMRMRFEDILSINTMTARKKHSQAFKAWIRKWSPAYPAIAKCKICWKHYYV